MKISDIAKMADVSKATVSRVLNNNPNVREDTRKKILEIIEENNYYPNAIARNLSKMENNAIGLIVPDIGNPFFAKIVDQITLIAEKKGLNVVLCNTNEDFDRQEKSIKTLIEQRIKGILIVVTGSTYIRSEFLIPYMKQVPIVALDRALNIEIPGVYISNYESAYNATKLFIKNGHKNIAIITGPLSEKTAIERFEGYKQALLDNKIEVKNEMIFLGNFKTDTGYRNAFKIFDSKDITGVFISNNQMALGFLKAAYEKKCNIPEDISVFSFEEIDFLDYLGIKISAYEVPFDEIGEKSLDTLLELFGKKETSKEIRIDLRLSEVGEFSIKNIIKDGGSK